MQSHKSVGFLMGICAAVLWGTFGTFTNFAAQCGLNNGAIALIAPTFLMAFFALLVVKSDYHHFRIPLKVLPALLILGGSAALFNFGSVQAYTYLPLGIVSTIIFCNLFILIFFSRLIFKTPVTKQKILAVCAAICGISMVVNLYGAGGSGGLNLIGIVWTLVAMVAWSGLVLSEKYLLVHGVNGNAILAYEGLFAFILIFLIGQNPLAATANIAAAVIHSNGMALLAIAAIGFLPTVLSYGLYISALKRIEPAYVQICYALDPVTSSLLGLVLFGQALLPIQFMGIGVILITVILLQLYERNNPDAPA